VPAGGGAVEKLPLGRAALLEVEPGTGRVAFNRGSRAYSTWKRYRGGEAQDIWVGAMGGPYTRATTFPGTDAFPMWRDGRLTFLSDQGGSANLWSMNADGSDRRPLTDVTDWDLRWPAMGDDGTVVAMWAGDLVLIDPAGAVTRLDIELPSESMELREHTPNPASAVSWFDLSPDGNHLAVVTRGDIVLVPVDGDAGITLPLTQTSGARERRVVFGPEGKRVAYVSDAGGSQTLVVHPLIGEGEPQRLDRDREAGWLFPPTWSPDGAHIAYADETFGLYIADVKRNRTREVARATKWEIDEYVWSGDGRWLAYTMPESNSYRSIFLYDTKRDETHRVTSSTTDDFSPSFAPDGTALYFISHRNVSPLVEYETRDFNHMNIFQGRLYACLLRDDVPHPFAPKWVPLGEEAEDDGEKGDDEPAPVEIDTDGLIARTVEVPVPAGRYEGLTAGNGALYYFAGDVPGATEEAPEGGTVNVFDLEEQEAKPFLRNVTTYWYHPACNKVSARLADERMVVVGGGVPPDGLDDAVVNLGNIVIEIDPAAEWAQKYHEAWRDLRDHFWDPEMGGVDWDAVGEQYATLLPRVGSPTELRDVIGQLIGELGTSHTYIWGGDRGRRGKPRSIGLLGIDAVREGDAYRIERIYRGDPADRTPSPLLQPGVNVAEGSYILAVNRRPLRADRSFEGNFQNLAGKTVLLTVNDRPRMKGAREVVVTPLGSDGRLRYVDWVRRNREAVLAASDGKIGYIHLPDMDEAGLREFETWFYPQLTLEGMVVDVRYNGGGWVSQLILDRLRRRPLHFDINRYGEPDTYPFRVLNGPFVVLVNEEAGSDGDIFPSMVQSEGLAPVIGTRSWGGVIGIRSEKSLVDGTMVTHPEFATWEPERGWILENHGVDPDIVIDNLPHEEAAGTDPQLTRAIEEVLRLHAENPPIEVTLRAKPQRSRSAYRNE
jgi:tricorn protease